MTSELNTTQMRVNFFQKRILRMVEHWRDHDAVQTIEVTILDHEREAILKAIALGLDFGAAWSIVKPLIITFTPYMERRGHWEAWNTILNRAIDAARHHQDLNGEITLTALLARLYQRQSRPQDTIYHYRRVIRLARKTNNRFEEARACSNLGYLYIDGGRWWRSEVLSCHALAVFEELDSDHGRAHTHNHLGVLYTRQRLWNEAERNLIQARDLWKNNNDDHSLIYGLENLGLLYFEMERPDLALECLLEAFDYSELTGETSEIGAICINIGAAYWQLGDLQSAETYTLKAESILRQFSNSLGLLQVWNNLGEILLNQEKWSDAKHYLDISIAAYRDLNNVDGEIKTLVDIIECELMRGKRSEALDRLNEIEVIMPQPLWAHQAPHLIERLEKYRSCLVNAA